MCVLCACGAHRTEQQAGETTTATAADHEHGCAITFLDEHTRCRPRSRHHRQTFRLLSVECDLHCSDEEPLRVFFGRPHICREGAVIPEWELPCGDRFDWPVGCSGDLGRFPKSVDRCGGAVNADDYRSGFRLLVREWPFLVMSTCFRRRPCPPVRAVNVGEGRNAGWGAACLSAARNHRRLHSPGCALRGLRRRRSPSRLAAYGRRSGVSGSVDP